MNKARSAFVLCLSIILICITPLSYMKVESASIKDTTFYIQFNSNGGTYCEGIYNILYGTTIELPSNPSKYNYWFRGWYCDPSFSRKFDPSTEIYQNMTLYAKWEQKSSTPTILSQTISCEDVTTTVTVDIANQQYGSACQMNLLVYDHTALDSLVDSICKTNKYIGFELNIDDLAFSQENPISTKIKIPSNFSASSCAVYYSTNRITVSGKPECYVNNNGELIFDAYYSGTYILVECISQYEDTIDPNAYVIIKGSSSVPLNRQASYNYKFVNFTGDESQINFTWYSSYPHIASIDKDGVLTAHSPGETIISCVSQNSRFVGTLKVVVPGIKVKSIKTNVSKRVMKAKKTFYIKTSVSPKNAQNKKLTFHSTNVHVATVNSKGKVVTNKKGTCYIVIRATDCSNVTKKVKVVVK